MFFWDWMYNVLASLGKLEEIAVELSVLIFPIFYTRSSDTTCIWDSGQVCITSQAKSCFWDSIMQGKQLCSMF